MSYFITKNGRVIKEDRSLVPMEEWNPLFDEYFTYLSNGGVVEETELLSDEEIEDEKKLLVPQELTPRQIRLALIQSGISLTVIDEMIEGLEDPQKSVVKTLREYSLSYNKHDEILKQFAQQLGLNDDKFDWLFMLWASL